MTMTASRSSRSESGDLVASGRARGVDCRVDQDKGLISIVENKLAASSEEEGERGAVGRVHWPSLAIWEAAVRKADAADGAGMRWISADDLVKVRRAARRDGNGDCSPVRPPRTRTMFDHSRRTGAGGRGPGPAPQQ